MNKRKQHVSDDNVMVSRSNKRSTTSGSETDYFDLISFDLVINILSKLPVNSIAKCRCVSKLWSSIIRRPNYNTLFPIKSPVTPRLLFVFRNWRGLFFSSSHQPQNPNHNSSLVAIFHHKTPSKNLYRLCRPVRGLVCGQHIEKNYIVAVICNPFTGESLTLPKRRMDGIMSEMMCGRVRYFFGYDPIEKQFKVLRITWLCRSGNSSGEYHVLTLGNGDGNLLWRNVQCCTIHYPLNDNGICINGILYYTAKTDKREHSIFCFDVRFENFGFTNIEQYVETSLEETFTLIDNKGRLGACYCNITDNLSELWVLEDFEKHKWSRRIYQISLPQMYGLSYVRPAGMIGSGEIVMYPSFTRDPFVVLYYNLEKEHYHNNKT